MESCPPSDSWLPNRFGLPVPGPNRGQRLAMAALRQPDVQGDHERRYAIGRPDIRGVAAHSKEFFHAAAPVTSCSTQRARLSRSRRSAAGFTLLELIVVVTVIGILALIALPALKDKPRRAAEAAGSREVQNARVRHLASSRIDGVAETNVDLASGFAAGARACVRPMIDEWRSGAAGARAS